MSEEILETTQVSWKHENFSSYELASFWQRACAFVLDCLIVSTLGFPVSLFFGLLEIFLNNLHENEAPTDLINILNLIKLLIMLSIFVYYYGSCYKNRGATFGKLLLHLRVIKTPYATHLSYRDVLLRDVLGKLLSFFTLGTGFLFAVFRKDKKALHDLISDTQVIRKV